MQKIKKIKQIGKNHYNGEVTQGLMEQWLSGDGGYRVSLYCKAKELQT